MPGILSHTDPGFYNDLGHIDATRVRDYLHVKTGDVASITGKSDRRIRQDPAAASLQPALGKVVYIISALKQLTGGDDRSVRIWLKAPHPALDGDSPIDLMRNGEIDIVQELVDHMLSGAPA
ncbi:MAG: antitoxin Xre/MbcA/ParS toxin-binding domain-containing protein [Truepera sp.]|jgi:uncharacterized protein (DUF2384 family)|nr:antitoxin Xre/MbcA/ParS toxin-binding domain-containing protein [Truepera sp.]